MSDRDALKARAEELKLDFAANIKTEKLEALVAEVEAALVAAGQDAANTGEEDKTSTPDTQTLPGSDDGTSASAGDAAMPPQGDDQANPFEAALTATAAGVSEISAKVVSRSLQDELPSLVEDVEVPKALRVQGPNKGFRRAGRTFGPIPVGIPLDELSEDELQALETEPRLMTKRIAMVPE